MDAHHHGAMPGLAALELAHQDHVDLPSLGTAAAHALVTPTSDNAHLAVGAVEGQESADNGDCAQPDDRGKHFATLRAHLALKGYSLSRTHCDDRPARYYVTRWGLSKECPACAPWASCCAGLGASIMGEFIRDRLPDPISYFDGEDVHLVGPGRWKTGPCHLHGGSDSMRVNTISGGWCCMNCWAKGGDVLDYTMQAHGMGFVEAAKSLGAYVEDGKPHRGRPTPTTLPAREAMQLVAREVLIALVVIADIRAGLIPSDTDWQSFIRSAGRIEMLATEYRT
jgi:hypothetical protein